MVKFLMTLKTSELPTLLKSNTMEKFKISSTTSISLKTMRCVQELGLPQHHVRRKYIVVI